MKNTRKVHGFKKNQCAKITVLRNVKKLFTLNQIAVAHIEPLMPRQGVTVFKNGQLKTITHAQIMLMAHNDNSLKHIIEAGVSTNSL